MREHENIQAAAAKASPPIAAASMTLAGYSLSDWVLLLTAIYTGLQILLLINGVIKRRRRRSAECAACEARRDAAAD